MNHTLYNISVFMLLFGLISLTYYLAKAYNKPSCPENKIKYKNQNNNIDSQFNMKPTKIFDKMFNKPDIWQGYESIPIIKSRI